MKNFVARVLELLFPRRCAACREPGNYCCEPCARALPRAARWHGETLIVFEYHHPVVRRLIWLLKYRGARDLAAFFAARLYEELIDHLSELELYHPGQTERWLIIPIPLGPKRLRARGFNQAAEIAKRLARFSAETFEFAPGVLAKIKDTPSQVSRPSREAREENLRGAFAVTSKAEVAGRAIILIDDVVTTGATLGEAARVLRAAGVKTVLPVAVAG